MKIRTEILEGIPRGIIQRIFTGIAQYILEYIAKNPNALPKELTKILQ